MTERDLNPDERQHELDEAIERDWLRQHRAEQAADESRDDSTTWQAPNIPECVEDVPRRSDEADVDAFGAGIDAIHDAVRK